jgi:pimeloyl-ACP methyl ester carboxylesterase
LIVTALISAIALFLAGGTYQYFAAARDRKRYPARGRLVSVNHRRLHVFDQGSGEPAVILEAGLAASSLSWSHVQPLIGQFTRAISYDRAGLGWSDAGSTLTLQEIINDLKQLLEALRVDSPCILVGHSFGSLVVRAFAYEFPQNVAGLVLVDPVSIEAWANCSESDRLRIVRGAKLSRRGSWLAQFGVVRLALAAADLGRAGITQMIARASAGKATPMLGRLVGEIRKLPPELVPVVRAHWSIPKSFRAMAAHLECLPYAAQTAVQFELPREIPIVVLSAANATEDEIAERKGWIAGRQNAEQVHVPGTGHWLHLERPEAVANAVRKLVEAQRSVRHGVDDVVNSDTKA